MAEQDSLTVILRAKDGQRFKGELRGAAKAVDDVGKSAGGVQKRWKSMASSMKTTGRTFTRSLTVPIAAVAVGAGAAAVAHEDAFAGVRKTVDATEKQYKRLDDGLRTMTHRKSASYVELAGIAEAAGQLGIARKNVLDFTGLIADLGVTTNLTGEEGATQLARFANIMGTSQSKFSHMGSTIVDLGNNLETTEAEIVGMALRLAGAGKQIGLTEADVFGLSGAMSSVGIQAEAGGTAMSTAMLEMNSAVLKGGKDLRGFAKVAGMSSGEFAKRFKDDAAGALVEFLGGLGRIKKDGGNVAGTLDNVGLRGARMRQVFLGLSGASDILDIALGRGEKAWHENIAMSEEAAKRYGTTKEQLKMLRNMLFDAGVTIGATFLPPLKDFVQKVGPKLKGAVEWFGDLPGPVKATAVGLIVLAAVIGPVLVGLGFLATGVSVAAGAVGTLRFALFTLQFALVTNPIFAAAMATLVLAAAFYIAYKRSEKFRNSVDDTLEWLKTNWPQVAPIVLGPLGLIAAKLYNTGRAAISLWHMVRDAVDKLVGKFNSIKDKIRAEGMWAGIKEAFRSAINWIIRAWNGLEFTIPVPGGGFAKKLGLGSGLTIRTPDIPMLATGGDIARRGSAIVGDDGPELLDLPTGARVTPLTDDGYPVGMPPSVGGDLARAVAKLAKATDRLEGLEVRLDDGTLVGKIARRVENAKARS